MGFVHPVYEGLLEELNINLDLRKNVEVSSEMSTNIKKVFAAGDTVNGASLVVTAIAHDDLLAALLDLDRAGRQVVLFTLAERPPTRSLPGILVYHLPHLVNDLITPQEVVV